MGRRHFSRLMQGSLSLQLCGNWLCTERAGVVTNELDEPLVVEIEVCLGHLVPLEPLNCITINLH